MASEMAQSGFVNITNIDISPTVIAQMKERYKDDERLQWAEMSVCAMTFPDSHFDLIIDKGTTDAIMCGLDWEEVIVPAVSEIFRVLTNGGKFILVSFGPPSQRLPAIRKIRRNWCCRQVIHIPALEGGPAETRSYVYVFEKGGQNP
jgi:ubiquinone/menaquinone biosynthesis C-methylase UbiE